MHYREAPRPRKQPEAPEPIAGEKPTTEKYPVIQMGNEDHSPKGNEGPSRRQMLRNLTAAVVALDAVGVPTVYNLYSQRDKKSSSDDTDRSSFHQKTAGENPEGGTTTEERFDEREKKLVRLCHTGPLKGKHVSGLAASYIGWHPKPLHDVLGFERKNKDGSPVHEAMPAFIEIHPAKAMEDLWYKKELLSNDLEMSGLGNKMITSYTDILAEGREEKTTLAAFTEQSQREIDNVRQSMDWEKVEILYHLDPKDRATLESLAGRITGKMLMSFSMTEIMSSGTNAADSALEYNFILENEGADFVTRVPAQGDKEKSFGFTQVTPNALHIGPAVGADGSVIKEYRGASKMNRAVDDGYQIPEEVQTDAGFHNFTNAEHQHRFAFLFALHNLADMIASPRSEFEKKRHPKFPTQDVLLAHLNGLSDQDLQSLVAMNHHQPGATLGAFLNKCIRSQPGQNNLVEYCSAELQTYAGKTMDNSAALTAYLG